MRKIVFLLLLSTPLMAQKFTSAEISRWQKQSKNITIIRDTWGIPHVYGKTDADAVFGLLYAQCEDDFARVEMNYITAEGRLAEVEGLSKIYNDLRMRLFQDTLKAIAIYKESPADMKKLMNAFADGINFFLHTHPTVKPKLLNRFQPWMPLLFSEGSIGGDIETVSLTKPFMVKDLIFPILTTWMVTLVLNQNQKAQTVSPSLLHEVLQAMHYS